MFTSLTPLPIKILLAPQHLLGSDAYLCKMSSAYWGSLNLELLQYGWNPAFSRVRSTKGNSLR